MDLLLYAMVSSTNPPEQEQQSKIQHACLSVRPYLLPVSAQWLEAQAQDTVLLYIDYPIPNSHHYDFVADMIWSEVGMSYHTAK